MDFANLLIGLKSQYIYIRSSWLSWCSPQHSIMDHCVCSRVRFFTAELKDTCMFRNIMLKSYRACAAFHYNCIFYLSVHDQQYAENYITLDSLSSGYIFSLLCVFMYDIYLLGDLYYNRMRKIIYLMNMNATKYCNKTHIVYITSNGEGKWSALELPKYL